MRKNEFSAAFSEAIDRQLQSFLIRADGQEDLTFALWTPSRGQHRMTAMIHTLILPEDGDRDVHWNVSFNQQYLERVCNIAMEQKCGVAFLHSHPGPGWQDMSPDDIRAEKRLAGPVQSLTELPLVGLTVGTDGTWSARFWHHIRGKQFKRTWCRSVRSLGEQLRISFDEEQVPEPSFGEMFKRTVAVFGQENHAKLARLRIGIVGLGSVGSFIAETLARMGMQDFVLIDFDEVQPHNLDRLVIATRRDIGKLKVAVAAKRMKDCATADHISVQQVPYSVVEEQGYRAALDCDVLFSCVDRPRARQILNHIAYAHLIPVIDGGIVVRFKNEKFRGADWQFQTVGPGRICLECLGVFNAGDASTEAAGKLDKPSYLKGLPKDHHLRRNENVFPFSANLASFEIFHLVAVATGAAGMTDFGVQRFRYMPSDLEFDTTRRCHAYCDMHAFVGQGDRHFHLYGQDLGAEAARARQAIKGTSRDNLKA